MQTLIETSIVFLAIFIPIMAVLGIAAFVCDHWDDSGKPLAAWLLAGFPSPWRYARRLYWLRRYSCMSRHDRNIASLSGTDPTMLIARGEL